jgi:N utilization substance protein A
MTKALIAGINQVATEKGLDREIIFDAIEVALVSAYKRNYGSVANVSAQVDRMTGDMHVFAEREVVEDVMNPRTEVSQEEAIRQVPGAHLGDVIKVETKPDDFGRIAAQTAKQVILQRIREAERDTVFENFAHRVNEILTAQVRSIDPASGALTLLLNEKHEVLMMRDDQIPNEKVRRGEFIKVFVVDVHKGTRGPVIKLSRTHRNLLRRLMEQEIPEVRDGLVEIKAIAREPGARSKAAVIATVPNVDPVGSCVGQRGLRIQNIVNELSGEKIDVVEWSDDLATYITNALSPAKVHSVLLDEKSSIKTAIVIVPDKQLSLAIGKEGQNARLAAKLTGWRIDIKSESEATAEGLDRIIAERATKTFGKSTDLLALAERMLKGEDTVSSDRFFQAAETVQSQAPSGPETAETSIDADAGKRVRKKPKLLRPTPPEATPELEEGLPSELSGFNQLVAPGPEAPTTSGIDLDDLFRRGLESVQSTPEVSLPSEEPFREQEAPIPAEPVSPAIPGAPEPLPQVITADMLRARMAQRKKETAPQRMDFEVPEELLAGYREKVEEEDITEEIGAKGKGKAKKAPDKKAKKKWRPDGGVDFDEFL